jgi:hypothetical protein
LSLIIGIYNQYTIGHLNFSALSKVDYPLDRLFASYLGSLAIPIIFFLSAYHLGRYSFLKNVSNFFQTLSQSITSKFLKISLISIGCILIAWFLITSLSSGTYEDCILDGKTGRTNAELTLLKNTCRGKFPILSKLSSGKSASIYCEMNLIANYKSFDGYVDFKNKMVNIGPVRSEIVSSNNDVIVMKMINADNPISEPPAYSKLDLHTGEFFTKVQGDYDEVIGNCVQK